MKDEGMSKEELGEKVGVKFDGDKSRYDLIPGDALDELAQVYTYGTIKYDDNNWRKGMRWGRMFAAMMRHAWAWHRGEKRDQESGLHHLAQVAWYCMGLINYERTHPELDDRVKDLVIEQHIPVDYLLDADEENYEYEPDDCPGCIFEDDSERCVLCGLNPNLLDKDHGL